MLRAPVSNAGPSPQGALVPDDYDTPWKEAIERHFADFLLFFFPSIHAQVDWSQPVSFLDQTLRHDLHGLGH